jgi:hypothetical protein
MIPAQLRELHEQRRRSRNNRELGRTSKHWMRLSKKARALAGGVCPDCGRAEDPDDPSTKLTCDLVGGGDHRSAVIEQVRVRCRRCHGRRDGGRSAREGGRGVAETSRHRAYPPRVGISLPARLKAAFRPRHSRVW